MVKTLAEGKILEFEEGPEVGEDTWRRVQRKTEGPWLVTHKTVTAWRGMAQSNTALCPAFLGQQGPTCWEEKLRPTKHNAEGKIK